MEVFGRGSRELDQPGDGTEAVINQIVVGISWWKWLEKLDAIDSDSDDFPLPKSIYKNGPKGDRRDEE